MAFLLGYDVGSSSVKAALIETETGKIRASAFSPEVEMGIISHRSGWAEQDPETWWEHVIRATAKLFSQTGKRKREIDAIGISYQMHGLVLVNEKQEVMRPSIIWCDSRAVPVGDKIFREIGENKCLSNMLNSPGNFTASRLKWVKDHEPDIYRAVYKFMLPGDFIAMKMTGEIKTTISGLSEGILWNFRDNSLSERILNAMGLDNSLVPPLVPTFSEQGDLNRRSAEELGIEKGVPVCYRAGDQPNNAFSLRVLNPGEAAATAGTSGVIYGITDRTDYDPESRVNTFVHVNHTSTSARYGVLLCINGTGILNSWLKNVTGDPDYPSMNMLASRIPPGSDGVRVLPFGNGAERVLSNRDPGAVIAGINFNRHRKAHILRAAQEGIVFALNYGFEVMKQMKMYPAVVRAGEANMFLSPVFREIFANTTGTVVELYNTDGAQGAARAAGVGAGIYKDFNQAFTGLDLRQTIEPQQEKMEIYQDIYQQWLKLLKNNIK